MQFQSRWMPRLASTGLGLCLGLAAACGLAAVAAQAPGSNPKLLRQYAKLESQAASQQGAKRAESLGKLAKLDFDLAHTSYLADQTAAGEDHLDLALQHADQACALLHDEIARGKKDGMKNVEVNLQDIAYGLRDLAQRVHFRQRPKVQAAASHFADLRAQLLEWMFAPKLKAEV